MRDQRLDTLAHNLINYSIDLKPGEKVLIENFGIQREFVKALVKEAYAAGGQPFVSLKDNQIERELLLRATLPQFKLQADFETAVMKEMDAYIGLRAFDNINAKADVPADKNGIYSQTVQYMHSNVRVKQTKWVVLRYPNQAMAQLAGRSLEGFEDFYFDVCNLDYSKMDEAMKPLQSLMERTDRVRLVGPGTDLSFSIKDIPAIRCSGQNNIPDGEVYTAPVKDSVNGVLTHNTPSPYNGTTFENIKLTFKDGKIVDATCSNEPKKLNAILDTDEGARYIGEFAIGVNPYIAEPMQDILFDEKIRGSFHFTPGQCYDEAYNGNTSGIHWDMVNIQRADYGGGQIFFDDVLIRDNGLFVLPELEALNPDNLK
ncbi:aminopeptidase [Brochothrix thermosphacta]|uniref:aminopeptidase n=1 Tax=Brochothrix thermosphacta TaxID=2756 RepID=UPI00083F8D84|nr:aminopeptidase [Brochothrix thermosphacta]ODJ57602.1 aminopeptidase [Brochothrix thermosphacta]